MWMRMLSRPIVPIVVTKVVVMALLVVIVVSAGADVGLGNRGHSGWFITLHDSITDRGLAEPSIQCHNYTMLQLHNITSILFHNFTMLQLYKTVQCYTIVYHASPYLPCNSKSCQTIQDMPFQSTPFHSSPFRYSVALPRCSIPGLYLISIM